MDELRGPNIQIVLHVKEGLGFGFLRTPFIVSGSLNGYMLETDPVVPSHAPAFDAELVWEADKRRFRSLRVQNVPVKVEVFTMATQGRKDKVGYLLLSLLGAQPCPSNKIVDVKHSWHRLLGVKSEGKCCHPQLMLSLSIEDRTNTPTPRNELRMFHSNEIVYPTYSKSNPPATRNMLLTLNEYLAESKKTATSPDLQPKLLCDEGLIRIGDGKQLLILSFIIGAVENLDMLLPDGVTTKETEFYVKYSVFTHNIMTDRVSAITSSTGVSAQFNQRTSLRLASDLATLGRYFTECSHMVARVCAADTDIGVSAQFNQRTSLRLASDLATLGRYFTECSHMVARVCAADTDIGVSAQFNQRTSLRLTSDLATLGRYFTECSHMVARVCAADTDIGVSAQFNQRTSLRLTSDLATLGRYFTECSHMVARVCAADTDIGICSMDLRKLIPTENTTDFLNKFCNSDRALTIHERCYILRYDELHKGERRPYVDVEMSLKYVGLKENVTQKPNNLTARSATQLASDRKKDSIEKNVLDCKSGSCTHLDQDIGGVAYTNISAKNTARYKNASGDAILQTNEIADLIKKMCDSFAQSQEKILLSRDRPATSDMQVQCEPERDGVIRGSEMEVESSVSPTKTFVAEEREPIKLVGSKSDTCVCQEREKVKLAIPLGDREQLMQKFVEELEDWKEKQQQLFKHQLKRKEDYHLELLSKEWNKKRVELECKLSKGIEQCRNLAADLSRATDDFRLRGYRNTEREKKLLDAKKALESHYTAKYQELRDASRKMEDDMNHRLKLKDMRIEEMDLKIQQLEKQVDVLKNNLKNNEKEAENKYSGLTKDQTASLIQELRCLEEKLDSAVQSKSFFKEQWGRAVRELHLIKLNTRKQMLTQLKQDRRQLGEMGLDTIEDRDEREYSQEPVDMKKLKDDFYVDILANTPGLESIGTSGVNGMDMFEDLKNAPRNPTNERLNDLIAQRDRLIRQDNPDEDNLKQLNTDIRNMLLNCGT